MSGTGAAGNVTELKARRRVVHGRGGNYGARISSLEGRMTTVEGTLAQVASDTQAIRSTIVGATKLATFAKKHGPRVIAFGTGLLAAAGIGNPAVWKFIGVFFGG